jgi:hypothetical protein
VSSDGTLVEYLVDKKADLKLVAEEFDIHDVPPKEQQWFYGTNRLSLKHGLLQRGEDPPVKLNEDATFGMVSNNLGHS